MSILLAAALLLAPQGIPATEGQQPEVKSDAKPAPDWPKFRGDLGNTGYWPGQLPAKLELQWQKRIPRARGFWSSPCVTGGKLFIGNNDGCVHCLDATTGELIWQYPTESGHPVYATPAVVDGLVYCAAYQRIFALPVDDPDGDGVIGENEVAWDFEVGPSTGGVNDVVAGSPAVVDGKLYLGAVDQYFYCLNAKTGKLLWKTWTRYRGQHAFSSSPAISQGKIVTTTGNQSGVGRVYCFDASDGDILWEFDNDDITFSSPAISGDRVFIANSGDWIGGNHRYAVFCLDLHGSSNGDDGARDRKGGKADLIWTHDTEDYVYSSPACHDGLLFFGSADGTLTCLDARSGDAKWKLATHPGRNRGQPRGLMGSPALAAGRVFIGTFDGQLLAVPMVDPNGDGKISDDEIAWSQRVGRRVVSSPVVSGGRVYLADDRGTVSCFGKARRKLF